MSKFISESWLVLLLSIVFAALLGATQTMLSQRIDANRRAALEAAVYEVVPNVAGHEEMEVTVEEPRRVFTVFKCMDQSGSLAGWVIKDADFGFQDKIHLVIGLTPDGGRITGLKVIENLETPGLGNKIAESWWSDQYKDIDASREVAVVKRERKLEDNEIQAITGATISSEAVTKIVNNALAAVRPELEKLRESTANLITR